MNSRAKAEKELRELYFNQAYLESLEHEIVVLNYEYGLRGVAYDGIGGGSGDPSDTTGGSAARLVDARVAIDRKIARYKNKINHIESVLALLTEIEYKIVMMRYIKYKPWWYVADQTGYGIRQAQRIKEDAIGKVAIGLYGSDE